MLNCVEEVKIAATMLGIEWHAEEEGCICIEGAGSLIVVGVSFAVRTSLSPTSSEEP